MLRASFAHTEENISLCHRGRRAAAGFWEPRTRLASSAGLVWLSELSMSEGEDQKQISNHPDN